MAKTQGHGNPNWTRDETLLALDLYLRLDGQIPGPTDPAIRLLSERIRGLPVHRGASKRESFRNPDGVAFKLQNIRQIATGRGLGNTSAMDRLVWQELGNDPIAVRTLATAIESEAALGATTEAHVADLPEEEEFAEGRVLSAMHRRRERDPKLRLRLLEQRVAGSKLSCDCCGDAPKSIRDDLLTAGFEAHHVRPLAQAAGTVKTKVTDLALLCAICHRLIHRLIQSERRWVAVSELKALLVRPRA